MAETFEAPTLTDKPKKRQKHESKFETAKKQRLSSHVIGNSCNCKHYKCFDVTTEQDRSRIIAHFNNLRTKNEQDSYLCGLINVLPVKRRRSRGNPEEAEFHKHSYKYFVSVLKDGETTRIPVCSKAFISIFGIKKARVDRLKTALADTGIVTFHKFQNLLIFFKKTLVFQKKFV